MTMESDDILNDEWEDALIDHLVKAEERAISSIGKPSSTNPSSLSHRQPPPQQTLPSDAFSTNNNAVSFSPPREFTQRPTQPPPSPKPDSDKDLEIERLKGELGRATEQVANLEKECHKLKKERDKKEVQSKFISSTNEEENARTKRSKSIDNGRDFGIRAPDHRKISLKFQNGVSSNDPTVENTVKAKGVETEMASHQEAQGPPSDDLSAYLDLSQKLLTVWGSPTDKKLRSDVIPKLLVGCQRDFHILFGCMSMSPPSEITRKLLTDVSSSGLSLHYVTGCFHTPEAAKVSHLYHALTKIADGTYMLETLIAPLLDLCGMENVVIVYSSLCILHTLLKLLLELENNFRKSLYIYIPTSGSLIDIVTNCPDQVDVLSEFDNYDKNTRKWEYLVKDNVFIERICAGKDHVDPGGLEGVKDGKLFNEDILSRKGCWNYQNALQPHVNWSNIFDTMHQIGMRITEESVRVEAVSIMILLFLRSNAYYEREQFSQKIVFKTISELLKKDAGLRVKKHALRLMYLVLNCPTLLATFCCGCKEGDDTSAMDDKASASDFQNFKAILQGLADCVASHGGGLLELKISRNAILVLAFLASSGQPGFEILVDHKLSTRDVNYLMLILQLLVSEMDTEAGAYNELLEISRERTFLIREILILLNRLVSSPSYSATILRCLTSTRDMAGLTIDVASRLSRKGNENEQQDSMVKQIRETEIVDLARLFKKRVFTYLGHNSL